MQLFFFSTHRNLWESVSQFTNAIAYVDIDNVQDEDGKKNFLVLLLTEEIKSLLINLLWLMSATGNCPWQAGKEEKIFPVMRTDQSDLVNWARKIHKKFFRNWSEKLGR